MKDDKYMEIDFKDNTPKFQISRREFFKIAGGGIFILFTLKDMSVFAQQRPQQSLPTDFNAFLKIGEDGRVTCFTGKIEMGQGVITSLAQMLADELDISVDNVDMVMGDTDLCPWDMGTFGSMSTRFFGPPLRKAGAEGRMVLLQLASEELKVPVKNLVTGNGIVSDKNNKNKKVTYAQLAKGKRITKKLTETATIKKPSEFKIMGKPYLRKDGVEKVTGKAKYSADIQLPGMLYAKILRPPAHGAKMTSVDLSEVKKIKDVQVVKEGDLIAVLHKYPDVAEAALSKIKAKFDIPKTNLNDKNIFDHLLKAASNGKVTKSEGDLKSGKEQSVNIFDETYFDGYKAHSPIEPHAALANIEGKKVTIWASTQTPFRAKEAVAEALSISEKNVRVIPQFLGGGFGGKSTNLQIIEAARLAKITGKPVQVAWTRKEEFFFDSFRPAAVVKIKSGVNKEGKITFWDYNVYFAGERGAVEFYNIPNTKTTAYGSGFGGETNVHPFATGPWRAPGNNTNTFARESQIDIMAAKAGIDPLDFRLKNLSDAKMRVVLKTAADKFGWKSAKSPSGRGYGIACATDAGTYVAAMAEVEVNKSSGDVKVKRVLCVQDMGLAINPEGAKIQMEGSITMGLGYTLKEDIHFKDGEIFDLNFDSYDIPRFSWLPKIETIIMDKKDDDPQGGGEPAIVIMGAVVANAIYDAVGARVMQLPMNPERVKEAMKI
ncbi:MAG: molybdopterin-dependent oxidoreductase [Ignavibacteriaceae bacterium]|nr:molybdopterin-dependent oxidoreductase [Ignavibacteriaceae bacterium]